MTVKILNNFNLGGLSPSKYQGSDNSMYRLVGLDLHSEPGVLKVNQKLTKDSGTTIDEFVSKILPCSDGNIYIFGKTSGKIWKRTSSGVYSLEATNINGGILDAIEDQGKIYYYSARKIGRWVVGDPWGSRNDSWDTFLSTTSTKHPTKKINLTVYIGDGNYVAQIKNDVFSNSALDLETGFDISALGQYDTKLLVGATNNTGISRTFICLWDTWSESYSNSDPIPETQINAFFETDNTVIVNCGTKGSLYQYSGGILVPIKRIPGTWTVGNSMIVHQNAVANIAGKPLFGFSNVSNNPNLSGVYSIGGFSSEYPQVLSLDYIISQNKLASIDVTAMVSVGDDLYVAWQDGTTFGIDKIDTLNKYANAYLESKVFMFDRTLRTNIKRININYRTMPTGSNIYLYTSNNLGTYSSVTLTNDSARKQMFSSNIIPNIFSLQLKIELAPNGNDAPEIESITFEY